MWRYNVQCRKYSHTVQCVKCGATQCNPRHTGRLSHRVAAIFHVLCHIFWFNPSQQRSAISQFHSLSFSGTFSQPFCVSPASFRCFRFRIEKSENGRLYWWLKLSLSYFLLCYVHSIEAAKMALTLCKRRLGPLGRSESIREHTQTTDSRMFDPTMAPRFASLAWGKPQPKKSAVQMEFCQIAFQPPHPQANERFVGTIFAENQ